jgi:hypothetical protein
MFNNKSNPGSATTCDKIVVEYTPSWREQSTLLLASNSGKLSDFPFYKASWELGLPELTKITLAQ